MTLWLPNRILQGAVLCCLAVSALILWYVLSQPWLGITLAADPDGQHIRIAAVHPQGPARSIPAPSLLEAVGPSDDTRQNIRLVASDIIEESDLLETYPQVREFMQRQTALAALLRQERVVLHLRTDGGTAAVTVTPARRPVDDLPTAFWVQFITGIGSLLIGAWVLAMRPAELATRLFALSGAMILTSAHAAAIYSSRELAIDGGTFRILSAFNHIGALGFGAAIIALFLCYPRQLVPPRALWIIPAITILWLSADILHLAPSPATGSQLPTALYMLLIVGLVGVQWFANRDDPRARAALRWLGLSVIVGAGAFVLLIIAPILVETAPAMQQGHAFGFFLLIYAGLALGIGRYRLFDLDEWAFRIVFYTAGALALLAIDALLFLVLHIHRDLSFGLALLAVAFLYLPLRETLWTRLVARNRIESHELFRNVVDISFTTSATERSERWRDLLRNLYDPLAIAPLEQPVADVAIRNEGLEVLLPPVADTPALILRYPWRGRKLFGTAHLELAKELVRLMRYAEAGRNAYERGSAEERRRIARDLHDDVGARLLSGLYKTEVGDTHRVLRDAIADIRTIVSGLSTDQLPFGQIIAVLRHETGERLAAANIEMRWPLAPSDDSNVLLDYRVYRNLVSAHREVVSNIIRHAKAGNVAIRIENTDSHIKSEITDDGIGIDPSYVAGNPQGSGLRGMIRRIAELDGALLVQPLERGTKVEIRIPFKLPETSWKEPRLIN